MDKVDNAGVMVVACSTVLGGQTYKSNAFVLSAGLLL